VGADVHGYLPWDAPGPMRRALAALRPAAVALVRTEIWPVLTRQATAAGCRLALPNAVPAASSRRSRPAARVALRPAYAPPAARVVVRACARPRGAGPARLMSAPHAPDEAHLGRLERALDRGGLRRNRLARVEAGEPPADVVVIDRVGVLAELYAAADAAYVG